MVVIVNNFQKYVCITYCQGILIIISRTEKVVAFDGETAFKNDQDCKNGPALIKIS